MSPLQDERRLRFHEGEVGSQFGHRVLLTFRRFVGERENYIDHKAGIEDVELKIDDYIVDFRRMLKNRLDKMEDIPGCHSVASRGSRNCPLGLLPAWPFRL